MAIIDWMDPAGQKVDLAKLGLSPEDEAWYREQAPRYFEGDTWDFAWMEPYRQLYGDPENSESFWKTQAGVDWLKTARTGGDAERDRQAAADDDGFGFLGLALGIALTAFGVPAAISAALEVPVAVGSAITGSLTSLVTGGNAAIGAVTGAAGSFFGGGADAESLAAADVAGGMVPEFGTTAAYDAAIGATPSAVAGDFVNPQDMLVASAGTSDVPQGLKGEVSGPESWETDLARGWEGAAAESANQSAALEIANAGTSGKGIINNAMDWVHVLSTAVGAALDSCMLAARGTR